MGDLALYLLATAGPLGGYLIGRFRPLWHARDWARWTCFAADGTPRSKPLLRLAALILLADELAWRAWLRRNDPPKPDRMPAPELSEKWKTILDERTDHDAR